MKFKEDRPFATPEAAERKLLELANAIEADHAGRLSVAVINKQFREAGGSFEEYGFCRESRHRARLRQRSFVVVNPRQIAGVDKAAANFATEIMISLADGPRVGALAHAGPARPRFIDRHDRRHLNTSQKSKAPDCSEADLTGAGYIRPLPSSFYIVTTPAAVKLLAVPPQN
jgi:hypothetical protein